MVFGGHRNGRNAAVDAAGSGRKYIDLMLERPSRLARGLLSRTG
jgi:hypothetical protein